MGGHQTASDMHSFVPQFIATLGATFGAFALGNVISWTSNSLQDNQIPADLGDLGAAEAWVVSMFMIGAACVPWVATVAFQFIGKKWTLISVSIPFIAGWLLLLLAKNNAMLLVGRFITGFCGGMFVLAAPAYSSEIAETKYRGALGTMMQLMISCGILFINLNCSTDWRVLSGVCIIFPALMAVWMVFMPRSPLFLVSKGDMEGAKTSLQWFRGGSSANVESELEDIIQMVKDRKQMGHVSIGTLLTEARYLKPLGIVLALMALQQLSGINYVLGYSSLIFKSAGTSLGDCVSAMLIGGVQVLGTFVTTLVIDKFGRKVLLIISELFICISMIGVAVFFLLYEKCGDECTDDENGNSTITAALATTEYSTMLPDVLVSKTTVDNVGFLPLLSLMIFIAAFAVGFGPIPWILNVELIPPEARALSSSLATSFNWIVSFLVAQFIPSIGEAIHDSSCYFIFSAIALLGTIFVVVFVPETKGKSEEDVKKLFSTKETKDKI